MVTARLVTDITQADHAGHVLQLAIAIGSASQAVQRMVGDVELHHALADLLDSGGLGVNDHARRNRCGAGSGCAAPALDLDHAKAAGAEGVDAVRGAKLGNLKTDFRGRAHYRCAFRHSDLEAIDGQCDRSAFLCRSAHVAIIMDVGEIRHSAASFWRAKSSGKWVRALMTG